METIPKNEARHIQEMIELMKGFLDKKYKGGQKLRMFHPKMHGCLEASFRVHPNLPKPMQQGLFATAKTYQAWIRFSNAPPNIQKDSKASGRGMAIKILNVEGPNLGNDPIGLKTQDFLMTTSPVLSAGQAANYKRAIFALTKGFPHNLGYILDPANWRRLYLTLKHMKKHTNLLTEQYFTGSPFLFGEKEVAAKFSVKPRHPGQSTYPVDPGENFLQEKLLEDLSGGCAEFDFLVQFQDDPKTEPVEDTSREWKTPFVKLASIHIPQQSFLFPARIKFGESLSFSPWHCLAAHRPLGGINRARKAVYEAMAANRQPSVSQKVSPYPG